MILNYSKLKITILIDIYAQDLFVIIVIQYFEAASNNLKVYYCLLLSFCNQIAKEMIVTIEILFKYFN